MVGVNDGHAERRGNVSAVGQFWTKRRESARWRTSPEKECVTPRTLCAPWRMHCRANRGKSTQSRPLRNGINNASAICVRDSPPIGIVGDGRVAAHFSTISACSAIRFAHGRAPEVSSPVESLPRVDRPPPHSGWRSGHSSDGGRPCSKSASCTFRKPRHSICRSRSSADDVRPRISTIWTYCAFHSSSTRCDTVRPARCLTCRTRGSRSPATALLRALCGQTSRRCSG